MDFLTFPGSKNAVFRKEKDPTFAQNANYEQSDNFTQNLLQFLTVAV